MMRFIRRTLLALGLALALAPLHAQTTEVSGVKLPDTIELRGEKLQLNGAGVRTRLFVKAYVTAIYVQKKSSRVSDLTSQPGPKRIHLHFLREIDGAQFGTLFTRAIADNVSREEFGRFVNSFPRMGEIFSAKRKLLPGETIYLDFTPGNGMQVFINGKATGEAFKEPEFFNSFLKIWVGEKPVDAALKPLLLGEKPAAAPQGSDPSRGG